MSHIRSAIRDDRGAITVDWAVLTASVLFIALGAINGVFKDAVLEVVDTTAFWVETAMPAH